MTASERETILIRIRERCFRYWTSKVGERADDIAQETIVVLVRRYSHVDEEEALLKLAVTISRLVAMSANRGRLTELPDFLDPADPAPGPQFRAEEQQRQQRVQAAIGQLTGKCPELLGLIFEGYTADEIKTRMGARSRGNVYVWLHRCKERLMKILEAEGGLA